MSEDKVWVDTFLNTPPLGTLFVKVGNIFEKGVQNSHYHEKCDPEDEHPERYTDPNDDWIRSYGADEVEFLSDEDGQKAAVQQLLSVKGRLILPEDVPEDLKAECCKLEALEEFKLKALEDDPKTVELLPLAPVHGQQQSTLSIYFQGTKGVAETDGEKKLYCSQDRYDIVQYLPVRIELKDKSNDDGKVRRGFNALLERYEYPCCPRILCEGQKCIPVGHIPDKDKKDSFRKTSQLLFYCPRCNDFYHPSNPILRRTPGYFFRGVKSEQGEDNKRKEVPYYVDVAKRAGDELKGWPEMQIFHPTIFGLKMMS